ncbi:hypothetical protein FRC12_019105 [Ceratobasidium sp. 428]|nr:hypothetical protein FRC12_019105 [Ceratobasidium sp. 428]
MRSHSTALHLLLYKRLVNASLISSQELLDRVKTWSSPGREGLLIMEFAHEWRSAACLVEQWYQTQLIERSSLTQPTNRFTVIQHRSTLNAPFFHEFLLIPLMDGSFYRVERTGVGSNVDAIRLFGREARDLIQWFPADQYEAFIHDKPSRLVAEVAFPHEFDILHILAWENLLNQAFDEIARLSSNPPKPEMEKYFALHLCSVFGPDNPEPARFLIDRLRELTSKHIDFRGPLSDALWWSNYGPILL